MKKTIIFNEKEIATTYFDTPIIARSGQVFRFNNVSTHIDENKWEVYSKDKKLIIDDLEENKLIFHCPPTDLEYWMNYFDLDSNIYEEIALLKKDEFLEKAFEYGRGMRILNQDLFETIISFILSQRKSIPAIKICIEKFCEKFGKEKQDIFNQSYHAFPNIKDLQNIELNDLDGLGFGYRSKYVYEFINYLNQHPNFLEKLEELTVSKQKEKLMNLYGVGEKVSNCILLFALHQLNVLPEDVWIQRVMEKIYKNNFPYKSNQGLLQQYLFFYILNHKNEFR